MATRHIIAISVVLLFVAWFIYMELKHRRFSKHMKVGDTCSIYVDADRVKCEIYHIDGDMVHVRDYGLNAYSRHRDEVYLAFNPLFYII
jgi:hypothetical protein